MRSTSVIFLKPSFLEMIYHMVEDHPESSGLFEFVETHVVFTFSASA